MSDSQPPLSAGERFAIAIAAFFRAVLRLIVVILAGAILAGLVYLGFVLIYQQAILPARQNTARLNLLETQQASQNELFSQRLEKIEQQITELGNQMLLLQDNQASLEQETNFVQSTQQAYSLQLERLDDLETKVSEIQKLSQQALQLAQENQQTLQSGELLRTVEYQLTVLKSAVLIQRARLYLSQANFGLARQEVRAARQLLVELQQTASEEQKAELVALIGRLDSALANLPERAVAAADDLRAAENLILLPPLAEEIPLAPLAVEETPSATPTFPFTPTPAAANTLSPTPLLVSTLTPTPSPRP